VLALSLDTTASGQITALDAVVAAPGGAGQMVSGASTAGSLIALNCAGTASWSAAITGTYTGSFTLYFEGSIDSTTGTDGNWISLFGRILGEAGNLIQSYTTTTGQLFEGSCGGLKWIRVRAVGTSLTTGPTITLRAGTVNTVAVGGGAVSVAQASATPASLTQGNNTQLATDLNGNLRVSDGSSKDVFGSLIASPRVAQFEVNHSSGADSTNITPTVTGSGTISYTSAPGGVTLATTGAISSGYNLTSVSSLEYRVGFEWYCYFTVRFPSASGSVGSQVGIAHNHQRIGLYSTSAGAPLDGFFVGFEGAASFGISEFYNGTGQGSFVANSAPSIAIGSFNGDKCLGSAGSAFTSNGSPVTIDFTKINLFRLRGGWLGTGVVLLEVCAPDGNWVTMHTYRNPNALTVSYASTTTWNYQVDLQNDASGSTAVTLFMGGASFGTTDITNRMTDVITNATLARTTRTVVFDSVKRTYRCAFSIAAVAGDAVVIQGSSTKTVKIREIWLTAETAQSRIILVKRSAADSSGTSTSGTLVPLDSTDAVATAVVKLYTAAPSLGSAVGNIYNQVVGQGSTMEETFGDNNTHKPVVLNSTSEFLAVNISANTTLTGHIEWTEE
jgi:hypothetical protein